MVSDIKGMSWPQLVASFEFRQYSEEEMLAVLERPDMDPAFLLSQKSLPASIQWKIWGENPRGNSRTELIGRKDVDLKIQEEALKDSEHFCSLALNTNLAPEVQLQLIKLVVKANQHYAMRYIIPTYTGYKGIEAFKDSSVEDPPMYAHPHPEVKVEILSWLKHGKKQANHDDYVYTAVEVVSYVIAKYKEETPQEIEQLPLWLLKDTSKGADGAEFIKERVEVWGVDPKTYEKLSESWQGNLQELLRGCKALDA